MKLKLLFSDYFDIPTKAVEEYGALDVCINSDLPLFIDPFLLFASEKEEYKRLHEHIVNHLIDLKNIAVLQGTDASYQIFKFPEIKQNWFGLCQHGNGGKGLGEKFALNLITAFNGFYSEFGNETISSSSHIEKLTLVGKGIGKDFISDFTTNLIVEYLLEYTETFANKYLQENQKKIFSVRCKFDKRFNIWLPKNFTLPYFFHEKEGDFILLTPLDILTKDEAFICHGDLYKSFRKIARSLENSVLRNSINKYFSERIPRDPKKEDIDSAISETIKKFPEILDYYIRLKEQEKAKAQSISAEKINQIRDQLINTLKRLCHEMLAHSKFFEIPPNSYDQSLMRAKFLKDVIENNDAYRIFYYKEKPIAHEDTIQRIFKLTWFHSPYDVNSEVNNGRGSADYKVSFGVSDSTIVEFKLGRSSSLKRNLENQTDIYKKASKSQSDIKVILCYNQSEIKKVKEIVAKITNSNEIPENIIIIDASKKISASNVK